MSAAWLLPVACTAAGLVALAPLRRGLGAIAWALAAVPVGYVVLGLTACGISAAGLPFSLPVAAAGLVAFAAATALLARVAIGASATRSRGGGSPGLPHALAALAAVAASSAATSVLGRVQVTEDSFTDANFGLWLIDTGRLDGELMSARHPLLPAIHAAERLLGAEIAHATFPVVALVTAALLGWVLWRELAAAPARTRIATVAATVALMVTTPVWLHGAFYAHAHMLSASMLLVAAIGVTAAGAAGAAGAGGRQGDAADAWPAAAGFACAGLALARPDGIAYAFVPTAVLLWLALEDRLRASSARAFFTTLLGTLWVAYGLVVSRIGVWAAAPTPLSARPGGGAVLALLALLTLAAFVPAALRRAPALRARLAGRSAWRLVGGGGIAVAAVVAIARPQSSAPALGNMIANLFVTGGWGAFWYAAVALALVALASRRLAPSGTGRAALGLVLTEFFAAAIAIHASGHAGRFGWSDSFTRVASHVVPLVFWYAALLAEDLRTAAVAAAPSDVEGEAGQAA